jgi:ferric-dicitrate binding protein FerR (iron transport regulator)
VASLIGEHSELSILENTAARVDLKLLAGRAQFDVVKNRARDFVVEAGEYHVTVVGTVFAVEHFERHVEVSVVTVETTALGAAMLAGLAVGFWRDLAEVKASWREERRFLQQQPQAWREELLGRWQRAVEKA